MPKTNRRSIRGDHCINVHVSYDLKKRIQTLAQNYDRTVADMVRALLRIGIPVMEGVSEAEEKMLKEYQRLFRKFRKMRSLKEL